MHPSRRQSQKWRRNYLFADSDYHAEQTAERHLKCKSGHSAVTGCNRVICLLNQVSLHFFCHHEWYQITFSCQPQLSKVIWVVLAKTLVDLEPLLLLLAAVIGMLGFLHVTLAVYRSVILVLVIVCNLRDTALADQQDSTE
jgi:hypothetical protein